MRERSGWGPAVAAGPGLVSFGLVVLLVASCSSGTSANSATTTSIPPITAAVATTTTTTARPVTTSLPSSTTTVTPTSTTAATRKLQSGNHYTIQSGDTLTAIGKSFGVTVAEIVTANKIKDPNNVPVGTVLVIPPHSTTTTTTAKAKATTTTTAKAKATTTTTTTTTTGTSTSTYTVKAGDTLSAIAAKFKVSLSALEAANGITDPNTIYVGQVLKIP